MWRGVLKSLSMIVVIAATSGCSYQYTRQTTVEWLRRLELSDHHDVYRQRHFTIPAQSHVCIATALNQQEESLRRQVAQQTYLSLLPYLIQSELIESPQIFTTSLKTAYTMRCEFLFYPQIVKQVDKVSSFVEIDESDQENIDVGFDRQWLQLSLWDVNSATLVDVALIKSRNKLFTIQSHQPSELLQDSLGAYVKQLVVANN